MKLPTRLPIPDEVVEIAGRLESGGYETWCVGGAIRDNLLGFENRDFDLTTAARPDEIRRIFRRTIPIGIEHGTVAVLDRKGTAHEVTSFRRDVRTDGRHAVVEFGVSLDEDLARRDFTINAVAYHPLRHDWRDPQSGLDDLEAHVVRAVGDPERRFREDYLRILRGLRFAARFDFAVAGETLTAMRGQRHGLALLSAERVRDEWYKGIETAHRTSTLVEWWWVVGGFDPWLVEIGARLSRGGLEDLYRRVDRLPPGDPVLLTAYLSDDALATLTRLKSSNADLGRAGRIAEFRSLRPDPEDLAAVRRWLARVGPAADDLMTIHEVDERDARLRDAVRRVRESGDAVSIGDLDVDGNDLLAIGIPAGPAVGDALRQLLDEVLTDPSRNERQYLLTRARRLGPRT